MTNTKCTILGCRYAEVSLSLERMREDFHTVQNGAIELAQEYNSKIAALEARCREQQEQFDALYSRNVFIEASLASCRAALYDVVHCSLELGVVKRAEMALGLVKETQDVTSLDNGDQV